MTGEGRALPASYVATGLAVPEQLDELHELLRSAVAEHAEVPAEALMMFETAVMEIAGNVVEHGRPHGQVLWRFDLTVSAHSLTALLSDSGEEYERPPSAGMPDEWAEAGRGLPMAEATLHELTFERRGEVNQWRMVRHYAAGAPEPAAP
ncbi:ATP-binding protein [Nocardioidaceae bacterium]|nr:ATP-binding protein [Nocardioidaceae bacterium]